VGGIIDIPDAMVLWQYWTALVGVSDVLFPNRNFADESIISDLSLPKSMQTQLQLLNSTGLSIIQNYIRKGLHLSNGNSVIACSLQIYSALFGNADSSPERCGICGLFIPAKSSFTGSCSHNHLFGNSSINLMLISARCSITLLTLSTPYVNTCKVCGRKKLDTLSFVEDVDWREMVFPKVNHTDLVAGFPEIERCLYCGGEWYRKF
jgi:hypothetical protein